ncbi:GNAT family N-acetyltransferase [Sphingobacterium deserti]|uniref:Acetyltransferase n=1 Tax=Sphingobacterium deserti TaxID=1229276 RepID=A0A0B8SYL0_9SPHI|nr:GNAT family N-acetyltransferase [Sphingobacterium deserti]KGE12302.1 acetyltransferase [Sphingobacterium deserti]
MGLMEHVTIEIVDLSQQEEVINYVIRARKELFPELDSHLFPVDLFAFRATYIDDEQGAFLVARDASRTIVAAIGMLRYDGRFPFLKFKQDAAVEIVRLYVDKNYRRKGLAYKMFQSLNEIATDKGVETLYLHTHPFLSGALEFWKKCGFEVLTIKKHGSYETIHMLKPNSAQDV